MMEMTGMNSEAAMMPGLSMSCRRLTPSATFDQIEISTAAQNAIAQSCPSVLSSGTSVKR